MYLWLACFALRVFSVMVLLSRCAGQMDDIIFEPATPFWPGQAYKSVLNYPYDVLGIKSTCKCYRYPDMYDICKECELIPETYDLQNVKRIKFKLGLYETLFEDTFKGFKEIFYLDINQNYFLTDIEPGAFRGLRELKNLSISTNYKLTYLRPGVFEGLSSLNTLCLLKNGLTRFNDFMPALSARSLPSLKVLKLNENKFPAIKANAFRHMNDTKLITLQLVLCQIAQIDPRFLRYLKYLKNLYIGYNQLDGDTITRVVEFSIQNGNNLRRLNLFGLDIEINSLQPLLAAVGRSKIEDLILADNQLQHIYNDTFPPMPNLKLLDLRQASIIDISKDTFTNFRSLKTLLLGSNLLMKVVEGALLPELEKLDLSDNSGSVYNPFLFSASDSIFSKMSNLKVLSLAGNAFETLQSRLFEGLYNLEKLSLERINFLDILPGTFIQLKKLRYLNFDYNPNFFHKVDCGLFDGLEKLEALSMKGCKLFALSSPTFLFKSLTRLRYLDLSDNSIVRFSESPFLSLINLEILNMSYNQMVTWDTDIFAPNHSLKTLYLHHNKITYISSKMFKDFETVKKLDLSDNPFYCNCSLFESAKKWAKVTSMREFKNKSMAPALCVTPSLWRNKNLFDYLIYIADDSRSECVAINIKLLLVTLSATLLVLIFGTVLLMHLYRWYFKYWIFLAKIAVSRRRKAPAKRTKNNTADYRYDAFVSHSNEDQHFVEELIERLEKYEPFLKLCVYERDFRIGDNISDAVLQSVYSSKKTILVVSDAFARSQWCRWEAQLAEHHRLFADDYRGLVDDTLILVKLRPVAASNMTPMLKYLMKTRKYLEWPNVEERREKFWKDLRATLSYS